MNKIFTTTNCNLQFDMEVLTIQNLKLENSEKLTVKSKSELFRLMYDFGMEICEIAKQCESHYSFVYGVISASREVRVVKTESKSDIIRSLVDLGKTPGEISKELNSNYSFVFSVVKKYKSSTEYTDKQTKEIVVVTETEKIEDTVITVAADDKKDKKNKKINLEKVV